MRHTHPRRVTGSNEVDSFGSASVIEIPGTFMLFPRIGNVSTD